MTYNNTLNLLIKVGTEHHIDQLQKNGLIHSKTVKYFREREIREVEGRKDSSEGAQGSINISNMKILVDNKELPLTINSTRLNLFDPELDLTHIFCLYAVTPDLKIDQPFIDKRVSKFGDTALLITEPEKFVTRVMERVKGNYECTYKPVHYYPDDGDYMKLTVFNKPVSFQYQREFRFHFKHSNKEDIEFEIGSIEDISIKIKSDKLPSVVLRKE